MVSLTKTGYNLVSKFPAIMERTTRTQKQSTAYNRLSRWYDILSSSERKYVRQGLDLLHPAPGECALEIGFGSGRALVEMAQSCAPSGQATGMDISTGMMKAARSRLAREGLEDKVNLLLGDGCHFPLPAATFDAVFLSFTLELFSIEDLPVVLQECRRALKPGGRLGVVSLQAADKPGLMLRLYIWAHRRFPDWVDCRPIFTLPLLEEAGFRILHQEQEHMWGLPVMIVIASPEEKME
jgi:ubiquinone/menaquinone biosynthesis C-methylase UbiE